MTLARTPILLVPGAWTLAAAFDDVAAAFEEHGHPTRVLELPARARRVPQIDRGGLTAIDRAVDTALDDHDASPILIGHSLGGLAALRASRRHDLPALVLLMPAPPTGLLRTILPGVVRDPIGSLSLLGTSMSVRLLGRLTSAVPPGLYSRDATMEDRRRAAAFRADESWSVLAAILLGSRERVCPSTAPTLVVAGSQDLITPTTIVRTLADSLHATLVEVDVAHAFNEEPSFTRVTDVVLEHLSDAAG